MSDCVFCQILHGEAPASFVHRDDRCSAFLAIRPVNPGHLLVIPNQHAAHFGKSGPRIPKSRRPCTKLPSSIRRCGGGP